ncbi:hypothetical protein DHEL01_v204109 [Diaporthe helianthi]|uniref:Glutamyl-tRNA amidotransferase complex subunit Gta3 domain-containing protein n=1 Tax=Diaporthe helianthi TaxID=158607 RepID=A0A2P5I4R7_DIAHE|nr:hypothetical protein DHEL01_v204109 [Diaporthe helianthi]
MGPGRLLFKTPLMASGLQLQAQAATRTTPSSSWSSTDLRANSPQGTNSSPSPSPSPSSSSSSSSSFSHQQHTPGSPDLASIFANPTWSVRSLLPTSTTSRRKITTATLDHLLRLSALPRPDNRADKERMLTTLRAQLHFVRDIRSVDTSGCEPLRSIRDETFAGVAESTITLETLREALSRENLVGYRQRPRRVRDAQESVQSEEERLVEAATVERRDRRYFVVASGKGREKEA